MNLELERKKLEIGRVEMSKREMEFHILEREMDIKRFRDNIEIQNKRINELKQQIKEMES